MARNKTHKQKFSSKRGIAKRNQGRVDRSDTGAAVNSQQKLGVTHRGGFAAGAKTRGRQSSDSNRRNKNEVVRGEKTIGFEGPPRICGIVNANESGDSTAVFSQMVKACDSEAELGVPVTVLAKNYNNVRFTLVCEGNEIDEQVALDIAKVSDIVILSLDVSAAVQETLRSVKNEMENNQMMETRSQATWFSDIGLCITDQTRELVQYINAQGSPSIVVVLQGVDSYQDPKRERQCIRLHERYFASVLAAEHKVVTDVQSLMRTCETMKLRKLHFREIRPYFVADDGDYDAEKKELYVSGYLRGSNLSAKQLIHITNHGTFQIREISAPGDPCPAPRTAVPRMEGVIDQSTPDERESMVEIQPSDTVMTEDAEGLPTAADVFAAAQEREQHEKAEKAKQYAEYEAAALNAENNNNNDDDDQQQLTSSMRNPDGHQQQIAYDDAAGSEYGGSQKEKEDNLERISRMSGASGKTDIEFKRSTDILRFEKQTEEEREEEMRRLREDAEDAEHSPDEKETPFHIPARVRFQKFRGLKSFQHAKWDPNENLPIEFGHIFKFKGFNQVRDHAVKTCHEGAAPLGLYVRITLVDVPSTLWDNATDLMLVSGLLPHENKWSVCHFRTQRNSEYPEPVKSKTPMLTHIGFRKFFTQPLFSEPVAMGQGRTKYCRYSVPGDNFKHVSFFAPISYYPASILMFKALSLEEQQEGVPPPLVCFGAALPPDPDFLILKRVVLTGRIGVVYKRQIVVRYMFWNDEDVRFFQPLDLYTVLGRRGRIKKPVGTHGMFKAELNDMTMQHDTICMDLWKRVFPKWKTVAYNVAEIAESTEKKRMELAQEEDVFED